MANDHTQFVQLGSGKRGLGLKGAAPEDVAQPLEALASALGLETKDHNFRVYATERPDYFQINLNAATMNEHTVAGTIGHDFQEQHPDVRVRPDVAARVLSDLLQESSRRSAREYIDIADVMVRSAQQAHEAGKFDDARAERLHTLLHIEDSSPEGLARYAEAVKTLKETPAYKHWDLAGEDTVRAMRRETEGSDNPDVARLIDTVESVGNERSGRITATNWGVKFGEHQLGRQRMMVVTVPEEERDMFRQQVSLLAESIAQTSVVARKATGRKRRPDQTEMVSELANEPVYDPDRIDTPGDKLRKAVVAAAVLQDMVPTDAKNMPEARTTIKYRGSSVDPLVEVRDIPEAKADKYQQVMENHGITIVEKHDGKVNLAIETPQDIRGLVDEFAREFPKKSPIVTHDTRVGAVLDPEEQRRREAGHEGGKGHEPPEQAAKKKRGGIFGWRPWGKKDPDAGHEGRQ